VPLYLPLCGRYCRRTAPPWLPPSLPNQVHAYALILESFAGFLHHNNACPSRSLPPPHCYESNAITLSLRPLTMESSRMQYRGWCGCVICRAPPSVGGLLSTLSDIIGILAPPPLCLRSTSNLLALRKYFIWLPLTPVFVQQILLGTYCSALPHLASSAALYHCSRNFWRHVLQQHPSPPLLAHWGYSMVKGYSVG
jgi:hypothetical protein